MGTACRSTSFPEARTVAEGARGVLDTRLASIRAITVAVVGVMRVRAKRQPELGPVADLP